MLEKILEAVKELTTRLEALPLADWEKVRAAAELETMEQIVFLGLQARCHAKGIVSREAAEWLYRRLLSWDEPATSLAEKVVALKVLGEIAALEQLLGEEVSK